MNWENILTGVVTGVIASIITAYLALRTFRAQRAFDRQLEWYERTVRAIAALEHIHAEEYIAKMYDMPDQPMKEEELQKGHLNMQHCVDEAVLYAKESSYELLREMSAKYYKTKSSAPKEELVEVSKLLNASLLELSKPVRKMLGLKEIRKRR